MRTSEPPHYCGGSFRRIRTERLPSGVIVALSHLEPRLADLLHVVAAEADEIIGRALVDHQAKFLDRPRPVGAGLENVVDALLGERRTELAVGRLARALDRSEELGIEAILLACTPGTRAPWPRRASRARSAPIRRRSACSDAKSRSRPWRERSAPSSRWSAASSAPRGASSCPPPASYSLISARPMRRSSSHLSARQAVESFVGAARCGASGMPRCAAIACGRGRRR